MHTKHQILHLYQGLYGELL